MPPRNATAISKLWKMPFHAISSGIFWSLEWHFSKFANCSGVFQSLQKLQWHFSKFGNCSGIFMNRHNWSGIYLICFWDGSRVSTGKFANCSGVFQSLQKLQWHFSKFGNCSGIFMNRHNWSGIYLICFWDGSRVSTGLRGTLWPV